MIVSDTSVPKWLVFQLVEKCNLRCKMCYQWGETGSYFDFGKENLKVLDFNAIKETLDSFKDATPYIGFYGGEPLLHPQFFEIVKVIKSRNMKMYADTNGTLNEKFAEQIVDNEIDLLWISLDGPPVINDAQRGNGVFKRVTNGIDKIYQLKHAKGSLYPRIGISLTVTPLNHLHIADLFFEHLDLFKISGISIELQNFITEEEHSEYVQILDNEFGIKTGAPIAKGLVQNVVQFQGIDTAAIVNQLKVLKSVCAERGINFNSSLKTLEQKNFDRYFEGNWFQLEDKKKHCSFPLTYAEISAKGDVVVCHSFYDHVLGNIYDTSFLDIWNGEELMKLRKYLRKQLLPICTACCRYYYNPNSKN